MKDKIVESMRKKDCILGIVPDHGGMWLSPLRPNAPRNFAVKSYAWNDAQAAISGVNQSHDFTFVFDFKNEKNNAAYVFAADGLRDFIRVFMSNGTVIVNTALLGTSPGGSTQFSAGSDSMNRHVLTVKFTGNAITALVDGTIIYTRENLVRNVIEIGTPRSNAGYVYNVSLTDDTTGETVWSASHDELYETNNPWPSTTPINFATQSYTWDSFNAIQNTVDFSHDFTFEIEFECTVQTNARIFYISSTGSLFGLYHFSSGLIIFTTCLLGNTDTGRTYTEFTLHPAGTYLTGRHIAKMVVAGNTATGYLDDVVIGSANAAHVNRVTPSNLSAPVSAGGYIYSMRLTDDTTGETVFSYPSEAERAHLLTKTNVRTDRGAFEAVDETATARVDTALDLRGKVSSYTAVVDFEAIALDGTQHKIELAGQGASVTSSPSICALAQSGNAGNIQLSQEINGKRQVVSKAPANQLGRHIVAGVVDVGNSSTRLAVYYDGGLLVEDTFNGIPAGTCDPKATNYALFDNRNGVYKMHYCKIYSALLFDRALTASEIAALVEPKKWILPVSDGNLYIRTEGLTNAEWLLPSGEKLHSNIINQNVTAGNVIFSYTGIAVGTGTIIMYNSTAIKNEFSAAQLPRVDYYLYLTNQSKLTGDVADLPRVSHQLFLQNLDLLSGDVSGLPDVSTQLYLRNIPNLSGNVADLPRPTGSLTLYTLHNITGETSDLPSNVNNLTLVDLPGITGSAAAIPSNSGYIRNVYNLAAITGALTVSAANTDVRFYNNSAVTAAEYDETITNIVAAGAQNGTLVISKSRTSASDENIEILRNRGWTVTEQ